MLTDAGAPYDLRAAVYDRLVLSRAYSRSAWSCAPRDYAAFAERAILGADGPVLEAAAGTAAATAALHARSNRPTVLVDLSRAMLERAGRRLAAAAREEDPGVEGRVRLLQADLRSLPCAPHGFTTVLALGVAHLFEDLSMLRNALLAQVTPGGHLHLAGLVTETRRGRRYLQLLHRAGEVATPRTAEEMHAALGEPGAFHLTGCMAYAVVSERDEMYAVEGILVTVAGDRSLTPDTVDRRRFASSLPGSLSSRRDETPTLGPALHATVCACRLSIDSRSFSMRSVHRRITTVARERGVSVATVVREAIDRGIADPADRRRSAGRRVLDAPDISVPETSELREELDALRARRA